MTLPSFIAAWLGKPCQYDQIVLAECVDLVNQWAVSGLGKPRLWGNACDLLAQANPAVWWRTANGPTNAPAPGAIVCWKGDVTVHGIGPYGHTAICVSADAGWLVTFDQDWPPGSPPGLVVHDYQGVAGWLWPR